jgi:hypothetical protein
METSMRKLLSLWIALGTIIGAGALAWSPAWSDPISAFSGGNQTAMDSNQRTYWGF